MTTAFVRRHAFATFVVLACAFSWWLVPIAGNPLGAGPFLAAVVVLATVEGRGGVIELGKQIVRWRVRWHWYALAVLLPAVAAVVAALVTIGLGAPTPSDLQLSAWTDIPFTFFLVLLIPLFGPWEEPGFRGYALTTLMHRRPVIAAGLLVGLVHVLWHLPLFLTGDIPAADVAYILAAAVVFAWIVVGSGGSVLMAMLMHASSNAISGEYVSPMFSGGDEETLGWVRAGIWVGYAVAVVMLSRQSRDRDRAGTRGREAGVARRAAAQS
jgi:CAAX protease family protein